MLTKEEFINKLQLGQHLDRSDFIEVDSIYYREALDIKVILDCPSFRMHANHNFKVLGLYFLHRSHNIRLLIKGCAEKRFCYLYECKPVWTPDFMLRKYHWNMVKEIQREFQGLRVEIDPESRMAIRHMICAVFTLLDEFKAIYISYNPLATCLSKIITRSDVRRTAHHPDCLNINCQFREID